MIQTIEIPKEFKRLFDSDWREAAVYGGRYSLKSHTVARILLILARQQKIRIACFREFQNSIADSSHQLLADLIKHYNLVDFKITDNAILNTVNGSDFLFKGLYRNEQSVKSIEGIDIGWVEEAQTVTEKSIEVLTPTIRKPGSRIIYTYNRLLEDDPVHKRLVIDGRPNTLIIRTDYTLAERLGYLTKEMLDEINDDKSRRPNLYKHKWLGEPAVNLEGKIYSDWIEIEKVPDEARLERHYVDFGYSNDPTAIGSVYKYNGGYIVDEVIYQKGLSNKQIADTLNNLPRALTIADSAEPKSIDEIRSYGVSVLPTEKGRDSVVHGIQVVQDQKIWYTKRSINIRKEYSNYLWIIDKEGRILNEPRDLFNHHMDGIRYAISHLHPRTIKTDFSQFASKPTFK